MSFFYDVQLPATQRADVLRTEFAQLNVGPDTLLIRDELFNLLDRKVNT